MVVNFDDGVAACWLDELCTVTLHISTSRHVTLDAELVGSYFNERKNHEHFLSSWIYKYSYTTIQTTLPENAYMYKAWWQRATLYCSLTFNESCLPMLKAEF